MVNKFRRKKELEMNRRKIVYYAAMRGGNDAYCAFLYKQYLDIVDEYDKVQESIKTEVKIVGGVLLAIIATAAGVAIYELSKETPPSPVPPEPKPKTKRSNNKVREHVKKKVTNKDGLIACKYIHSDVDGDYWTCNIWKPTGGYAPGHSVGKKFRNEEAINDYLRDEWGFKHPESIEVHDYRYN